MLRIMGSYRENLSRGTNVRFIFEKNNFDSYEGDKLGLEYSGENFNRWL